MQSISIEASQTEVASHFKKSDLRRCLSAFDLTLLGIGSIIGAGIFVMTGIAAATVSGPGIILSYILAGVACGFCALAYAELASSLGGCGSAYGYAYVGIGKLTAWLIGWDLLLEYGLDASLISIGWSGYVDHSLKAFGINLPKAILTNPFEGGIVNLPAILILLFLSWVLSIGTKQSALFNNLIVYIKLAVIALFVVMGTQYFDVAKWSPFLPFGPNGIVNGAGLIFFAYIGFDIVSTAGEEANNPKRDLPIGIIASLIICTVIYVMVSGLLTGIMHYSDLNVSSPIAMSLAKYGHKISAEIIAFGAIAGLTTAILGMYYGFTRVFLAMARDGFLPRSVAKIHEKSKTPRRLIWTFGIIMMIAAGFFPIEHVANLVNCGTLAAFIAVCICVIVLRYTKPNIPRPFKTWSPIVPLLGIVLCFYTMINLPSVTWISFTVWTLVGLLIYFLYSRKRI